MAAAARTVRDTVPTVSRTGNRGRQAAKPTPTISRIGPAKTLGTSLSDA